MDVVHPQQHPPESQPSQPAKWVSPTRRHPLRRCSYLDPGTVVACGGQSFQHFNQYFGQNDESCKEDWPCNVNKRYLFQKTFLEPALRYFPTIPLTIAPIPKHSFWNWNRLRSRNAKKEKLKKTGPLPKWSNEKWYHYTRWIGNHDNFCSKTSGDLEAFWDGKVTSLAGIAVGGFRHKPSVVTVFWVAYQYMYGICLYTHIYIYTYV